MDRIRKVWTLVLLAVLVGCAHNPAQLRPGAFNTFDQDTHDVLRTAQATLEQAAKDVAGLQVTNPLRVAYNVAIDAYNAAEAGYQAYHAALVKGQPADQTGMSALIQGLKAAVARYAASKTKPVASREGVPWALPSGSLPGVA